MNSLIKKEYDYAVRICAYLAGYYGKGPVPVSRISQLLYISKPFTAKIIFKLRQGELVGSVQGKAGGIYLAKEPSTISLFTILDTMGFDATINECLQTEHVCPLLAMCKINTFFAGQQKNLIKSFQEKYISEFAFTDEQLGPIYLNN